MKKLYTKPYLAVESFQLDAAIASSCSQNNRVPLNHGINTCTLEEELPNLNYFGDKCIIDYKVDGDGNDLICYHGPVDPNSMFLNS